MICKNQEKGHFGMKKMQMQGLKLFTLIELLVVIAVVSILAALLLPALGKARQKVMGVSCLGNERQVGIGFQMYLNDFNLYFPPAETPNIWSWEFMNVKYVPNLKVFLCPVLTSRNASGQWIVTDPIKRQYCTHGIGYNGYLGGYRNAVQNKWPDGSLKIARLSRIKEPSRIYLAMDSLGVRDGSLYKGELEGMGAFRVDNYPRNGYQAHARHLGSVNIAYVDGRASAFKCSSPSYLSPYPAGPYAPEPFGLSYGGASWGPSEMF